MVSSHYQPLFMGFDLSTQQLKAVVVSSGLEVEHVAKFDFDADSDGYNIKKGVMVNEELHEVYAPVALWLQALDGVMERLKDDGMDFSRLKAVSGAGQQHGSVYWSAEGEHSLQNLYASKTLEKQLDHAFSYPFSPNWQDASTQTECDIFDKELSSEEHLSQATGSKAHHRFTGPQILRFQHRNPEAWFKTSRISLVSSFLASIFLGRIAPIDISDVCGMNLWDIQAGKWNQRLLSIASNGKPSDLEQKLGQVPLDGGVNLGTVSKYFVDRYGFASDCRIVPFTGDNPSTILALPLRANDAMVSLGTSTTFLMSTPIYKPEPSVHFFNHPTTPGLYMFMLCYKNGGLAREHIRDAINARYVKQGEEVDALKDDVWSEFNSKAAQSSPMGQVTPNDSESQMRLGLYFPRPEIVPNVRAGTWRFFYAPNTKNLSPFAEDESNNSRNNAAWNLPFDDARAILESQLLSLRLRSRDIVESPSDSPGLPSQPGRIYLVGGGSKNPLMADFAGNILGGSDGVYKLDIGENACALGAAYKAVWAADRKEGETFEQLIGSRWDEEKFVSKTGPGFDKNLFAKYGQALEGFEKMENVVLEEERQKREQEGRGKGKRQKVEG